MKERRTQLIGIAVVAALAVAFAVQSSGLTYPSYVFPRAAISVVLVLCAINAYFAARGKPMAEGMAARTRHRLTPAVAIGAGATILYVVGVNVLGFYVSTFVFLALLYNWFSGREFPPLPKLLARIAGAAAATALIYLVFAKVLLVQTPRGFLM